MMRRLAPFAILFLTACSMSRAANDPSSAAATSTAAPTTTASTAQPVLTGMLAQGATTFTVYEGFMSPPQQPGEESDASKIGEKIGGVPGATQPSIPRDQRPSRGYGQLRFTKDLTRAYVDVEIAGVNPADIMMFHIHCGPPGVLGPIILDLGTYGDLTKTLANGKLSVEVTNKNIVFVRDMPHGLKPTLPESCPVEIGFPTQSMTVAAMEYLARKGVLYFNLHTKANSYYGEVRGQIYAADKK